MARQALIVTCKRCRGSYDMDMQESWGDHHTAPDGTECAPADGCEWRQDRLGRYCITEHGPDSWVVETVLVADD